MISDQTGERVVVCGWGESAPSLAPAVQPTADTTAVEHETKRSGEDVRRMAAAPEPVVGPLICTCVGEVVTDGIRQQPPFVVFDGWHRGAAWVLHGRAGRAYPITARIIATQRPAPLLGQA